MYILADLKLNCKNQDLYRYKEDLKKKFKMKSYSRYSEHKEFF